MIKLFKRHYNACVNRGKINAFKTTTDFIEDSHAEDVEMLMEKPNFDNGLENNFIQEAVDSIMVRINMLQFLGVDIEKELEKNTIYQENRED